jgi:anti-sigma factor RsiW
MTCDDVRMRLLDHLRRRLDPAAEADVRAHLRDCAACSRADAAEVLLDDLLSKKLPRYAAPPALKRRLGLLTGSTGQPRAAARPRRAWARAFAPALAAGLALFAGGVFTGRTWRSGAGELDRLASEAVADHLRVLVSGHPYDVAAGGSHQVKPWFEGKLDFAPEVPLPEVPDLRLEGGSVGWFLDRRAAVVSYALRDHRVTLLACRGEGLSWPGGGEPGAGELREASIPGFRVVMWRAGELGYALVSDVNAAELKSVAAKFAAATR